MSGPDTLAAQVGEFASRLSYEDIPNAVTERGRHLILDAVGIALASTSFDFSKSAVAALASFGTGDCPILGMPQRLPVRDAALVNGALVHGLDFDDTHVGGIVHVTSGAFPAALAAAVHHDRSCREMLAAYVLAVEVAARVGIAGAGRFHDVGYHPTGVAGAFGAAVAAAKLAGLEPAAMLSAQGIVGSMAAGLFEFLEDGSWTKRQHPGWAAASGLTAAALAGHGWVGPPAVYEGRFGLFATHLQDQPTKTEAVVQGLGTEWELMSSAVKPYPICHFIHAFVDSILLLLERNDIEAKDVAEIHCGIHPVPGKVVCEPLLNKRRPTSDYEAKFSLPYVAAATAVRRRLTLAELETDALSDPDILDLTGRVHIQDDPDSAFPDAYSGVVELRLHDGRRLSHREQVNRGHADRPLTSDEIVQKYIDTASAVADRSETERIQGAVLDLGSDRPAREFAEACVLGH